MPVSLTNIEKVLILDHQGDVSLQTEAPEQK